MCDGVFFVVGGAPLYAKKINKATPQHTHTYIYTLALPLLLSAVVLCHTSEEIAINKNAKCESNFFLLFFLHSHVDCFSYREHGWIETAIKHTGAERENYRCTKFSLELYELRRRQQKRATRKRNENPSHKAYTNSNAMVVCVCECERHEFGGKEINVDCKKKSAQTRGAGACTHNGWMQCVHVKQC